MIAYINRSIANGSINIHGSKSLTHRALICAALSNNLSKIDNILICEDTMATVNALQALGAKISISNNTAEVRGINFKNVPSNIEFNCNNSGSTLRFIIPILLYLNKPCKITLGNSLKNRPLNFYDDFCKKYGCKFTKKENILTVKGKLNVDNFAITNNLSSQFVSGLLFALPMAKNESKITFNIPPVSKPYIDLTVDMLKKFGITTDYSENTHINIPGNQKYVSKDICIEGDYSSAAVYFALNAIGSNVTVNGLNPYSLQGDRQFEQIITNIKNGNNIIDISNIPDLAPLISAIMCLFNGGTIYGTERLIYKESNRAFAITSELKKFGAEIKCFKDKIVIKKAKLHKPKEILNGYNDHRIIMMLAFMSTCYSGEIENCEAVNKSYPEFFNDLKKLGIGVSFK